MADKILDGVIAMNKPVGMSSAQVIRDCQSQFHASRTFEAYLEAERRKMKSETTKTWRRRSDVKRQARVKMGHGGTLDPLASGVLILGINAGTKSLSHFLDCTKTYEAIVVFGVATDTSDRVGRVAMRRPYAGITRAVVEKALPGFRGTVTQTPPVYSALKMDGKPLYEYARAGQLPPRPIPQRQVQVEALEILEWYEPGTHKHYWPTEETSDAEKEMVEKIWTPEGALDKEDSPREQSQGDKDEADAIAAHEAVKRKMDTEVDELVKDRPKNKRPKLGFPVPKDGPPMMSGALSGSPNTYKQGKGSNLIPETDENAPPPWEDAGPPAARLRMTVSSGFFVRSLCHDLGLKIGSAGIMAELVRTRQGDFSLGGPNCLDYNDLDNGEDVWAPKLLAMMEDWNAKYGAQVPNGGPSNQPAPRQEPPNEAAPNDMAAIEATTEAPARDEKPIEAGDEGATVEEVKVEATDATTAAEPQAATDGPAQPMSPVANTEEPASGSSATMP